MAEEQPLWATLPDDFRRPGELEAEYVHRQIDRLRKQLGKPKERKT